MQQERRQSVRQQVFVVDDNHAVRHAYCNLLDAAGYSAQAFASAEAFFQTPLPDLPVCLILDMHMPQIGGLEVAAELARRGQYMPIIFVTAFVSVALAVQAFEVGALQFLTKPVESDTLLRAVNEALLLAEQNFQQRQWR